MQFNYIKTMVTTNEFLVGINDNGPDKFRCDNLVIAPNKLSNSLTSKMMQNFIPNINIQEVFNFLEDENTYEVIYSPEKEQEDLFMAKEKMQKYETTDSKAIINSISSNLIKTFNIVGAGQNYGALSLVTGLVDLGFNIAELVNTIDTMQDKLETTKDFVNEAISSLNERIDDNRKFIAEATERINKNKQKYVKMS